MKFRILGPLEVDDAEGNPIRLPTGRERALLVALLLRRGEVVSMDALIEALWGERAPSTAGKAVQGYVSHLRRLLGGDGAAALVTRSPGYMLHIEEEQVDAARFARLAAEGQGVLEDGDPSGALATLDASLALWRGPALAEFAFDDFAQREIQRLTERRLEVTEDRVDALLQLGRHGGLVSELESLVAANPLRERPRGQLMLALYRSGRPADALQVYKEGARLSRELGLDPAAELRRLEKAILEQDPSIAAPAPAERKADTPSAGDVAPDATQPRGPRRFGRRHLAAAAVVAALLVVGGIVALDRATGGATSVAVLPPAVVAVDPETNRVVASIKTGSKPVTVTADNGAVWVGDTRDGTLTRIDPETRSVVKTIGVGAPAVDIAASDGSVWVATGGFGSVVQIDAELNAEVDTIELGQPNDPIVPSVSAVAAGREGVWLGAFDGLVRIDPGSGRVAARVDLGRTPALQIAVGGGAVWSTIASSRAKRVEASSAQETAEFYAGHFVFPIALDRSAVWVGGLGQMWKVDPVTGGTLLAATVESGVEGIALQDDAVWATIVDANALVRLDPETGRTVATIPLEGWPGEVAVEHGLVWVTVQESEE